MTMSSSSSVRLARLLLAVVLILTATLNSAPVARADAWVVDRADDLGGQLCTVAPDDCSLRSAIERANTNGAVADQINFATNLTINLASTLQLTADNTTIVANPGQTVQINGAGITISASSPYGNVFRITGSGVKLQGLRVYGSITNWSNIWITGTAQGVSIARNLIGDDTGASGGCGQSPNSYGGVFINSTGVVAPDSARAWIYGNLIVCNQGTPGNAFNPGDGVTIQNSDQVLLGVSETGASTPGERNFIQNNGGNGVTISEGAVNNQILNGVVYQNGNSGVFVDRANRTTIARMIIHSNTNNGVELVNGTRNTQVGSALGGPTTDGNAIKSNGREGIYISGSTTETNVIFGNQIGADLDSPTTGGNGRNGIMISNRAFNTIIGATANERNVIAGNGHSGVLITGATTNNLVQGNYIGTDVTGTQALPNGSAGTVPAQRAGVTITGSASDNTIGGTTVSNRNLISGNAGSGVYIADAITRDNLIDGNAIGINAALDGALGNGDAGIALVNAGATTLGHSNQSNVQYIAGNRREGIYIENTSGVRILSSHFIGYGTIGNGREGILLNDASNTVIQPYSVMHNGGAGIAISGAGSLNNAIIFVENYGNRGLAIDLGNDGLTPNDPGDGDSGPNTQLNYPLITSVSGTTVSGTACPSCAVYVYTAYGPVGAPYGGGGLVGGTVADGAGSWSVSVPSGYTRAMLTAFAVSGNNASEMTPRPQTYLPLLAK